MSDLPPDEPRLRIIEHHLLVQLAAVRIALHQAEHGPSRGQAEQAPRWCIQWRWVPAGQLRRGVLHRADCWMAKGDLLDTAQVAAARRGRTIEACDVCQPEP